MFLWRISNYANLDGTGGLAVSGRWHTKGHPILYCAISPSTALLETLVHMEIDAEDHPERFQVLKISAPKSLSRKRITPSSLSPDWRTNLIATQSIGDKWLHSAHSLLLEVPSVLVPETWNVLINLLHPQVSRLSISEIYHHPFDLRFFP